MVVGTGKLVGPGKSKRSGLLMHWTMVWLIGWGPEHGAGRSSSSTSSMKADCGKFDPTGKSAGCSWLVACMVFSGVEEESGGDGHRGDGGEWSVIRTSTDVDDARDDTGATQGKTDTGTREETEDATS